MLKQRHGDGALLVDARRGGDGRMRVLAVLDVGADAAKAETKRLAATGAGAPAVEIIDRATWLVLCRLQACGMVNFAEGAGRVLHRAAGLADNEAEDAANAARARVSALRAQAERALRMARVLAAGGFAEEALPQLAKAIAHGAAARLAELGDTTADTATPAQIRNLVERGELPTQTLVALDAGQAMTTALAAADIEPLIGLTAGILANRKDDIEPTTTTILAGSG